MGKLLEDLLTTQTKHKREKTRQTSNFRTYFERKEQLSEKGKWRRSKTAISNMPQEAQLREQKLSTLIGRDVF